MSAGQLERVRNYARSMAGRSETNAFEAALWFKIAHDIDDFLEPLGGRPVEAAESGGSG